MDTSTKRQKVKVSGYWLDSKEEFKDYLCIVNATQEDIDAENEDDQEIFFYFETWENLWGYMKSAGRTDTEFVLTSVESADQ